MIMQMGEQVSFIWLPYQDQPRSTIKPIPYGRKSYSWRMNGRLLDLNCGALVVICASTSNDGSVSRVSAVDACWDPRGKFLSHDQKVEVETVEFEGDSSVWFGMIMVLLLDTGIWEMLAARIASASFCWRSKSRRTRWTVKYSHCETLKGSQRLPIEKSHQHRSMARMTVGRA